MSKKNYGLELYKLIMTPDEDLEDVSYVSEFGWINTEQFCVWVGYIWVSDFVKKLKEIFGEGMFDDGGFDANMQSDGICIDLCEALGNYMDIEEVFPKEYSLKVNISIKEALWQTLITGK